MLKSPNDVLIESKDGRGNINMKGTVNIETANIRTLSSNTINDLKQQLQDIRRIVNQLSNNSSNNNTQNTNVLPTNLQSVVQQVIRQQFGTTSPVAPVVSSDNTTSLINARLNTLQDQMNALETRINTALVTIDERFVALQNSVGSTVTDPQTNSPDPQVTSNNNVVILRKTPVTNKNVRYAW